MAVKNVTTLDPMNLFDITAMLRGAVALCEEGAPAAQLIEAAERQLECFTGGLIAYLDSNKGGHHD
jgi:hypothetical protein